MNTARSIGNENVLCGGMSHSPGRVGRLIETPKGEVAEGALRTVEKFNNGTRRLTCSALRWDLCKLTHLENEGGKRVGWVRGRAHSKLLAECPYAAEIDHANNVLEASRN